MTVDGMTHMMEDVVKCVERAINKPCCATAAIKNSPDNFISEA